MGGGTLSLFSPAHIDRLLRALDARLSSTRTQKSPLKPTPARWNAQFAGYRAAG